MVKKRPNFFSLRVLACCSLALGPFSWVHARSIGIEHYCESLGESYGSKTSGQNSHIKQCFNVVIESARTNRKLFASSTDTDMRIYGYKNMIFIEKNKELSVISGEMANLNNIENVAISPDGKSIAVLNYYKSEQGLQKKQISYFESSLNGNVVPFSINSEDLINNANSISFLANDTLLISTSCLGIRNDPCSEIVSVDVKGDSRSPLTKNKPASKIIVSSKSVENLSETVDALAKENELVILDKNSGLHFFKLHKNSYILTSSIKVSDPPLMNLGDLNHISYSATKKVLNIFDSSGKTVFMPF